MDPGLAFASFSYLLSGGFSKPALFPTRCLFLIQRCDRLWSRWSRWLQFLGIRCLVDLMPL